MHDGWKALLVDHLRRTRKSALPVVERRCRRRLQQQEPLSHSITKDFKTNLRDAVDNALVAGFAKATKERTANSLAFVFWQSVRGHLLTVRKPPVTLAAVAAALGVSASNLGRWGRTTVPSANKFFLAALTWSIDVRDLSPDWAASHERVFSPACYASAIPRGLAVALQQIRVNELGEEFAVIGLDELACVGAVKRDGAGIGLLPGPGTKRIDVAEAIIERVPELPVSDSARLVEIMDRWLVAYTLFDEVRPDWRFLNGY